MAGSSADTPATPEFLRASDEERDQAVAELRNEFAQGRLSHETFVMRMQTALGAQNRGELARLFTDLPPRRVRLSDRIRAAWRGLRRRPDDQQGHQGQGRQGQQSPGTEAVHGFPGSGHVPWSRNMPPQGPRGVPAPPASPPTPLYFPPGSGTRFTIGRAHDCDLRLTDLSVSRRHAELTRGEDGWLLSDLGSHNGTRLNGWLIREPVPVRVADLVEFGSAAFIMKDPVLPGFA